MKHLFKKGHKHSKETKRKISIALSGDRNWQWKGGRFDDGHGYWRIKVSKGRYAPEHRVIMEKHLGRKLEKWEHVHHIDGNKKNNDLKNLVVMIQSAHHKLHLTKYKGCKIKGCNEEHRARKLCVYHYNKELKLSHFTENN